jgi:hypothetical protein
MAVTAMVPVGNMADGIGCWSTGKEKNGKRLMRISLFSWVELLW